VLRQSVELAQQMMRVLFSAKIQAAHHIPLPLSPISQFDSEGCQCPAVGNATQVVADLGTIYM